MSSPAEDSMSSHQPALEPIGDRRVEGRSAFEIPVTGGGSVRMIVPLPLTSADVAQMKRWLDLMEDVLTQRPSTETQETRDREGTWLKEQVERGLAQLDRGEKVMGEPAFDRILDRDSRSVRNER